MISIKSTTNAVWLAVALGASVVSAQSVTDSELEAFIGLPSGALDDLSFNEATSGGDVTSGSALQTTFVVSPGDTLSLTYNFITEETPPDFFLEEDIFVDEDIPVLDDDNPPVQAAGLVSPGIIEEIPGEEVFNDFNDFAFLDLDGLTSILAEVNSPGGFLPTGVFVGDSFFEFETGPITVEFTFDETRELTLSLGVVDVEDFIVDSALVIEALTLNGVPLPGGDFANGDASAFDSIGDLQLIDLGDSGFTDPTDLVAAATGGSFQLVLTNADGIVVPEPATLGLLVAGALAFAGRARKAA